MARRDRPANHGAELRAAVLAEVVDCLGGLGLPTFDDGLIGPLERGEAVAIKRWDLPDWCPERHVGAPSDDLVLGVDNKLREAA
jgi:hypothetical protein